MPHQLAKKNLDARVTATTIEVFHKARRVASHARSNRKGGFTTVREHMPPAHQAQAGVTRESLLAWADQVGPNTVQVVDSIMAARTHPQQAYKSCLGVLRRGKTYGDDRLEAACRRAVTLKSYSYKSIDAILKNRLDEKPLESESPATLPKVRHENVRGGSYYATLQRDTATATVAQPHDDTDSRAC